MRVGWSSRAVLRWFGHMERMEEDWLVKSTVGCDVKDVRRVRLRGRSRTGWMDGVKKVLNERGMSV